MANTLTLTISAAYSQGTTPPTTDTLPGVTSLSIVISGNIYIKDILVVSNVDTTIPLGGLTTLGVSVFKNLDPAIAISVRVAAAGTKIIRLLAGECWVARLDSGITAPVAIADSGSPLMYYALLPP